MPPDYSAGSPYHVRRRAALEPAMLECLNLAMAAFGTPRSLLDVGCGEGKGIDRCLDLGIRAIGVDLGVVEESRGWFVRHDLHDPLDLGVSFDWVLCLEVAEHLEAAAAGTLCDSIVRHVAKPHGRLFFTAAVPGQHGPGHLNCQPLQYWRTLLESRGLVWLAIESQQLSGLWTKAAPRAPWYGRNLQIFGWA